jgi:hypothetical protein
VYINGVLTGEEKIYDTGKIDKCWLESVSGMGS